MADIRVKPTKRTPVWVWIVIALVVLAAVAAVLWYTGVLTPADRPAPVSAVLTRLSL